MRHRQSTGDSRDDALLALLRAIGSLDTKRAMQMLETEPSLALQVVVQGATRQEPKLYFLETILHYIYGGDTALHIAAAAFQRDIAKKLLSNGANVNARNRRGAEPLHYASDGIPGAASFHPKAQASTIKLLIEAGADTSSVDKSGVMPLHRAVRTRSGAAVRALLEGGADARRVNKSGSTPLHLAVQNTGRGGTGSPEARAEQETILRLLFAHGACATDKDGRGKRVTDVAPSGWIHDLMTALG